MAREWTTAQKAAIDARDADILVAAAAGSGKTAVLVERIIERITDREHPVDLDRLLVVTFTNAAAAEMRQRVGDALSQKLEEEPDNKLLAHQLALLPKASITTIDAYCHKVLRANFNALGLDPTFRIADSTENELLRAAALDEVMESMYEDEVFAEDFLQLTEAYLNIKAPDPFYALVNHIYDFAMSLPEPTKWLDEAAERFHITDFEETEYAKVIVGKAKQHIESILSMYDAIIPLADRDDGCESLHLLLLEERDTFAAFLKETTYSGLHNRFNGVSFANLPRVSKGAMPIYREEVCDNRNYIRDTACRKKLAGLLSASAQEQTEIMQKLYPVMRALSELVKRLRVCFDEKKDAKNILNYNDLEHGCYRLFVDENGCVTELALAERECFDEILIDEYQDTSALQEAIFSAIKKDGGLFLVGDVKQSIYRFRNTNPKLFSDKKDRYDLAENAPQRKIILSKNFRSRREVLDCINFIFQRIMSAEMGEVVYNEEEKLNPGAKYDEMEHPIPTDTEILMVELGEEKDEDAPEKLELEAMLVAKRIQELIASGYQIQGKNGVRRISYRDICILLRSQKGKASLFCKVLADWGIPSYSESGDTFLNSREITVMLSLLKMIDNPHQDIPLLAVLRSQLYGLSNDELAEIRLAKRKGDLFDALTERAKAEDALALRLTRFLEQLTLYREKSRELDTAELVWYLYMQTGFYEGQAATRGGELRRMNLRLLYTRAAEFEKTGLKGLYNFIRFIDDYKSMGGDYDAARTIGEEQDVVRVMSIHKSKGLEFPVVFLCDMNKQFNEQDAKQPVLIHSELGYGPKYVDPDVSIVYESSARVAVKSAMRNENLSEEMRILYVAMTRAREKLIMTAAGDKIGEKVRKKLFDAKNVQVSPTALLAAKSYLDWILMALYAHPDGKLLRKLSDDEVYTGLAEAPGHFVLERVTADELQNCAEQAEVAEERTEETGKLPELLEYEYPFGAESSLPAKITVTEIKRKMQGTEPDSVYLFPQPAFLRQYSGRLSAAEAGTAMHSFLEQLDYSRVGSLAQIEAQLTELVEKGVLSDEEQAAVSAQKVLTFTESPLGVRIRNAQKLLREVSFGLYVDAEPLFDVEGKVMLQGMIDCVLFEEDGISIVDYKTDRDADPMVTKEKYRVQLACYAKAAETMYGLPVKHQYLYLFHHNKTVEM